MRWEPLGVSWEPFGGELAAPWPGALPSGALETCVFDNFLFWGPLGMTLGVLGLQNERKPRRFLRFLKRRYKSEKKVTNHKISEFAEKV